MNAERYLLAHADAACSPVIFRVATLYGLSPRTRFDMIVNQFVLEAYTKRALLIYQRGYSRSFLHLQDAMQGLHLGLTAPRRNLRGDIQPRHRPRQPYQGRGCGVNLEKAPGDGRAL